VDLAQTGRGQGHAAVALDQVGQFGGAAALEEGDHRALKISHGRSPQGNPRTSREQRVADREAERDEQKIGLGDHRV
jgi:hypothetical protein